MLKARNNLNPEKKCRLCSMIWLLQMAIFFTCLLPVSTFGYEIENIQFKVRTHQLPKFCLCAGYPPPDCSKEKRLEYIKYYGSIFLHVHHYCWGLDKLNIQLQSGKPSRFWLKNVVHEFDYVLHKSDPKRSFHAEIWTKKGQVLLLLRENVKAVESFYNAIKSNKHYIPAYIYLSQYLKSTGDFSGACNILKFGVQTNPNSKRLKRLLASCEPK